MATMTYTERNIVDTYSILFNNLSDVCKIALADRLSKAENKVQAAGNGLAVFGQGRHFARHQVDFR
jgi:hypothetical protein